MKAFLKILVLAAVVMTAAGCGGHYMMDQYIDQSAILSSNAPDAIKVYVGECRFNDGPGGPQSLNKSTAEGEISPWIKTAIKNEIENVRFVENKQSADISIEPQKVEINMGGWGAKFRLTLLINGQKIVVTAHKRAPFNLIKGVMPLHDIHFVNGLKASTKLLALTLKQNIQITDGRVVTVATLPSEVEAKYKEKYEPHPFDGKLYDIEVTKADD